MAEQYDRETHYDETTHARNPPNSVLNAGARNAAWWSFVAPLIALAVVVGIAFLYWSARGPGRTGDPNQPNPAIGPTGESIPAESGSTVPNDRIPGGIDRSTGKEGGGDPAPLPSSTSDELERRGVGEGSGLTAPRQP